MGFVILNEVMRSIQSKNLNLCQQEAYRRSHPFVGNVACPVPAKAIFP